MAFVIKNPPEFTLEVEQWNRETLADGVEMAKVPEALLNNEVYLKEQMERQEHTAPVTLTAAGWSAAAPYTQTVPVTGITASAAPIIYCVEDVADQAAMKRKQKAFSFVTRAVTGEGTITFYCNFKKPAEDLNLTVKGV